MRYRAGGVSVAIPIGARMTYPGPWAARARGIGVPFFL